MKSIAFSTKERKNEQSTMFTSRRLYLIVIQIFLVWSRPTVGMAAEFSLTALVVVMIVPYFISCDRRTLSTN